MHVEMVQLSLPTTRNMIFVRISSDFRICRYEMDELCAWLFVLWLKSDPRTTAMDIETINFECVSIYPSLALSHVCANIIQQFMMKPPNKCARCARTK